MWHAEQDAFTRRMAALGATVVAFDASSSFIDRSRRRTPDGTAIDERLETAWAEPQYFFHRPLATLLRGCFEAGFVMDGIEERGLPAAGEPHAGVRWMDMPDIPPILVVRMRLKEPSER